VEQLNRLIEIDEYLRDELRANSKEVALVTWEQVREEEERLVVEFAERAEASARGP